MFSPQLGAGLLNECAVLKLQDVSDYTGIAPDVICRTIIVKDECTGALLSSGASAQTQCVWLNGNVAAGDSYTLKINNCTSTITVTGGDLVPPDEFFAFGSFEVLSMTFPGTASVAGFQFGVTTFNAFTFNTGATLAETAFNLAQKANNVVQGQGLSPYFKFSASGNRVTVKISPAYYEFVNGVPINNTVGLILQTPPPGNVTFNATSFVLQGGQNLTITPQETAKRHLYQRLYDLLLSKTECFQNAVTFSLDLCSANCPIKITAAQAGVGFTASASTVLGSSATLMTSINQVNGCNLELPTSASPTKNDYYVKLPNKDTILSFHLFVDVKNTQTSVITTYHFETAVAILCKLECAKGKAILAEANKCCDSLNGMPLSCLLEQRIAAIRQYACQKDFAAACALLTDTTQTQFNLCGQC